MPTKERSAAELERAKRIREAAREHETSNDPKDFERAFGNVLRAPKVSEKSVRIKK